MEIKSLISQLRSNIHTHINIGSSSSSLFHINQQQIIIYTEITDKLINDHRNILLIQLRQTSINLLFQISLPHFRFVVCVLCLLCIINFKRARSLCVCNVHTLNM